MHTVSAKPNITIINIEYMHIYIHYARSIINKKESIKTRQKKRRKKNIMIHTYLKEMIDIIHPLLSVLNCEETISSYDNDNVVTKSSTIAVKKGENGTKKRTISALLSLESKNASSLSCCRSGNDDVTTHHHHYLAVTKNHKRRKMLVPKKKKKTKNVRFMTSADAALNNPIVHIKYYSTEDIQNSWYNKNEYQMFLNDVNSTVEFFSSSFLCTPPPSEDGHYCSRGVEAWYCQRMNFLKVQSRKVIVNSIIQRQIKLNNGDRSSCVISISSSDDREEILRKTSLVVSRRSCEMAICLAVLDAIQKK